MQNLDGRLVRAVTNLVRFLDSHDGDAVIALSALDEDVRICARRINETGGTHSTFDLLEYVRYGEIAVDQNTYRESSHEGSPLLVELVALALTAQPCAVREDENATAAGVSLSEAVPRVLDLGVELFDLVATRGLLTAVRDGSSSDRLANIALARELFVRGSTYEHVVKRVLVSLFDTPEMESLCRKTLGCTIQEACEIFLSIRARCNASIQETARRMERFEHSPKQAIVGSLSDGHGSRSRSDPIRAMLYGSSERIWFPIPEESTFRASDLAAATDIPLGEVKSFLEAFQYVPSVGDAGDVIMQAVRGPSPLRMCPILRADDLCFIVHCSFGLHGIREAIESRLKGGSDWQEYQRRRGDFLESEALHLLSRIVPSAEVHGSIHYYGPKKKNSAEAQGKPRNYSTVFETDGLVVVDDVALVVEAKAGAIRLLSRSGVGHALKTDLEKIIRNASDQADRVRRLIVKDGGIQKKDGSWIDLSNVREVHSMTVSLEDLSGLATTASELLNRGIIPLDAMPWSVSLLDLHVLADVIQTPAELILCLRRRTNPEIVKNLYAYDELDYFMAFLRGGLRGDDKPYETEFVLPEPARSMTESHKMDRSEPLKILVSHTEPLDAWYLQESGIRTETGSAPRTGDRTTHPADRRCARRESGSRLAANRRSVAGSRHSGPKTHRRSHR